MAWLRDNNVSNVVVATCDERLLNWLDPTWVLNVDRWELHRPRKGNEANRVEVRLAPPILQCEYVRVVHALVRVLPPPPTHLPGPLSCSRAHAGELQGRDEPGEALGGQDGIQQHHRRVPEQPQRQAAQVCVLCVCVCLFGVFAFVFVEVCVCVCARARACVCMRECVTTQKLPTCPFLRREASGICVTLERAHHSVADQFIKEHYKKDKGVCMVGRVSSSRFVVLVRMWKETPRSTARRGCMTRTHIQAFARAHAHMHTHIWRARRL